MDSPDALLFVGWGYLKVKEIQEETELEINRTESLNLARQKVAAELSQRLRELKLSNSQSTQKGSYISTGFFLCWIKSSIIKISPSFFLEFM